MRNVDRMSRNFLLLDATYSLDKARQLVEKISPESILMVSRSADNAPHYYLYRSDEFHQLLAAGTPEIRNIGELNAGSQQKPAQTIQARSSYNESLSKGRHVVLLDDMPIGVLIPTVLATGISKYITKGDIKDFSLILNKPFGSPNTTEDATVITQSSEALLNRILKAKLPESISLGVTVTLAVSLDEVTKFVEGGGEFQAVLGTKIYIKVFPVEGMELKEQPKPDEAFLEVTAPQSDRKLIYRLVANQAGNSSVKIIAFKDASELAAITLVTQVIDSPYGQPTRGAWINQKISIETKTHSSPDLSLYIIENGNQLQYLISSPDQNVPQECGAIKLDTHDQEFFRIFFQDLEKLKNKDDAKQIVDQLVRKGRILFEKAIPRELQKLLWEKRNNIRTVHVISDEPFIPWELCMLYGVDENGEIKEQGFWGVLFSMTRWLRGPEPPRTINFNNLALVIPGDSNLKYALGARQYFENLQKWLDENLKKLLNIQEITPSTTALIDAMATGTFDAWHFSGHAKTLQGADNDQSALTLEEGEEFKAEYVSGKVANMLNTRPFIFLNGCQTAQGGITFNGMGGWANRFIRAAINGKTASAFIGPYWSVNDEAAEIFSEALYDGLIKEDKTIGDAVRDARNKLLGETYKEKPGFALTALAYTVYADPFAKVRINT